MLTQSCIETKLELALLLGCGVSLKMLAHDVEPVPKVFWESSCYGMSRDEELAVWRDTAHAAIAQEVHVSIRPSRGTN
ncbi:Hypothetical Protein FCC1311_115122 [Hondaea fermentalgiana]|uniref:Uncharacterized protein n=1 Tax=Hondaea fermentalgiana TaxID=2315210 RepID=A0A2R5GY91_9STRA|nr:Hypothetical Protein FCC1311_115122 [Hondaea fermentalgiana]|eukprot:GBG35289.1 Hypothetical Protein FCC1311_115122 [Hondaea fermentalgiana]